MQTQAPNDELMQKLIKILKLANDKGATPGEVEAAMAMAKRLADKNHIDLAMVNFESDPTGSKLEFEVTKEETRIRSRKFQPYHMDIFHVMEEVFGVRVILFRHSGRLVFVGAVTDVLICKELLPWLEDVFYSTYCRAKKLGVFGQLGGNQTASAAQKRGVWAGLRVGIIEANRREQKKASTKEQGAMAVVLRRKEDMVVAKMQELFPNLKESKARTKQADWAAYNYGTQEGAKVRLDQVGAAKSNLQIQ